MSAGLGLLKKFLTSDYAFSYLSDQLNLSEDSFKDDEKTVYEFISDYLIQYGERPSVETINAELDIDLSGYPDDSISYWADRVDRRNVSDLLINTSNRIKELTAEGDLETARVELIETTIQLRNAHSVDRLFHLPDCVEQVLTSHDVRQKRAGINGVSFGFPYIDEISDGAQPGDSCAIVGTKSVGKSYILLNSSLIEYLDSNTAVPLFVTCEMPAVQCARRLLALKAKIPVTLIRTGKVGHFARKQLDASLMDLREMGSRPFYIMQGTLRSTIDSLALMVQEVSPTVLYVDGAYLLKISGKPKASWEIVKETAEFLRQLAADLNIPIISTYQFNRKGKKGLDGIGGSDAVGQLAAIVIKVEDPEGGETWDLKSKKILTFIKGREGEKGKIEVLYDMSNMIIKQLNVLSGYKTNDS
jgi:replicative DNA helicase